MADMGHHTKQTKKAQTIKRSLQGNKNMERMVRNARDQIQLKVSKFLTGSHKKEGKNPENGPNEKPNTSSPGGHMFEKAVHCGIDGTNMTAYEPRRSV